MKKFLLALAAILFAAPAFGGDAKYPADASPASIAIDKAVKAEIAGNEGVVFCALIDTKTGKCVVLQVLEAGGGDGGGAGGSGE